MDEGVQPQPEEETDVVTPDSEEETDELEEGGPRRWPWIVGGLVLILLIGGVLSWKLGWYTRAKNHYQRASVTLEVREGQTFPVKGATLSFNGATYTTDDNGKVAIVGIVAGSYQATVKAAGYSDLTTTVQIMRGDNALTYLGMTRLPDALFAIKGFVQDYVSAMPIANVSVTLNGTAVLTDASGAYSFTKLPKGDYSVSISYPGYTDKKVPITLVDADSVTASVPLVPKGLIVFTSNATGQRGIYSVALDGTGRTRLAAATGEDYDEQLSPDGKNVAFYSTRDNVKNSYGTIVPRLYIASVDGKNVKKISDTNVSSFSWSSSGSYIEYSGTVDLDMKEETTAVYDVAKGTLYSLVASPSTVYDFSFSPDGKNAAYSTTNSTTGFAQYGLYSIVLGSGKITQLIEPGPGTVSEISVSADNKSVSYALAMSTMVDSKPAYYSVPFGGGDPTVTSAPSAMSSVTYTYSPDGKRRVFVDVRDGKTDVYMQDADGKNEVRITKSGVVSTERPLIWDTSGKYVSFAVSQTGEQAIYLVATAGGNPKKVTDYYASRNVGY
jgi:Tol biopolymer transport system component